MVASPMNTIRWSPVTGILTAGLLASLALGMQGCGRKSRHHDRNGEQVGQPPPTYTPTPTPPPVVRNIAEPTPQTRLAATWNPSEAIPKSFPVPAGQAVPIDIQTVDGQLTFDAEGKTGQGTATVTFTAYEDGLPFLDLTPEILSLALDGVPLSKDELPALDLPNKQTTVRVLQKPVKQGEVHTLTISWNLLPESFSWIDGTVVFGAFMSDLAGPIVNGRPMGNHYLERYLPTNLEFDAFRLKLDIKVLHAQGQQQLFSNGRIAQNDQQENHWEIVFPEYFTASSPYLHLTGRPMIVKDMVYQGMEKEFPIRVYGPDAAVVDQALKKSAEVVQELETTYGAFAHEQLVVYVTKEIGGGMEYAGATATSPSALPHEITHSWFARGVMPADGNSGWIDEAIARWRDRGYPSQEFSQLNYLPELAAGSPYQRYTNGAAYGFGSDLLASIDSVLRRKTDTNLRTILAKLYAQKKRDIITTPYLKAFIEGESQLDFSDYFNAYAFDKRDAVTRSFLQGNRLKDDDLSHHHAPIPSRHLLQSAF